MSQPQQPPPLPETTAPSASLLTGLLKGPTTSARKFVPERVAAFLGCDQSRVFDVLRVIWTTTKGTPPLTNQELMVGMALVARYELDPFAREIYVTRGKKGLMVIVGVDGWIRVLDRTDHYDGMDVSIDRDGDDKVVSVTTTIYSKNRSHPAQYVALADEYRKLAGPVASTIFIHMLRIFSLKHAARLFVPLGSVVTEEEANWMADAPPVDPVTSLDNLADKLTEPPPLPSIPKPPPAPPPVDPKFQPPTPEDIAAEQAFIAEALAVQIAEADTADEVSTIRKTIVLSVGGGTLTEDLADQLYELANGATDRIGKSSTP